MLKQLMILCSDSIGDVVTATLEKHIQKEGYVRMTNGYGVKCKVPVEGAYRGKCIPWEAEVFLTALPDETVRKIVEELKDYTKNCETESCLRMIISPVDEVI